MPQAPGDGFAFERLSWWVALMANERNDGARGTFNAGAGSRNRHDTDLKGDAWVLVTPVSASDMSTTAGVLVQAAIDLGASASFKGSVVRCRVEFYSNRGSLDGIFDIQKGEKDTRDSQQLQREALMHVQSFLMRAGYRLDAET